MKQKSLKQLQSQVDEFNSTYKVGDTLLLEKDSGEKQTVTVYSPATVLGGHSAVGWFEEISGCYSLDRVCS